MSKRHRLQQLLENNHIWTARDLHACATEALATGFPDLDEALAGGWPTGVLIELLLDRHGIGELRLLAPALARLSASYGVPAHAAKKWLTLIGPPYIPYAPALVRQGIDVSRLLVVHCRHQADTLWAMEQALRSATCAAVLAWSDTCDDRSLRRLQLASEEGRSWAVLFRPSRFRHQRSPASVRMHLYADSTTGITVNIFKNRGGCPRTVITHT